MPRYLGRHPTEPERDSIDNLKDVDTTTTTPDATNKLISGCKFVLSISPTTAVNYCVLYNKPITFIYNDQMVKENIWQFKELKLYSNALSSKMINLNHSCFSATYFVHSISCCNSVA